MSPTDTPPFPLPDLSAALGDRAQFPDLRWRAYLNHAAISPPSTAVRQAMAAALTAYATDGVAAFVAGVAQRARLKARLTRLFGGRAEDYALVLNTSAGLNMAATSVPWRRGDRVLLFRGEFPTNITPWQRAAEVFGLELVFAELTPFAHPEGPDLEPLEQALRQGVRLVAASAVQFQTGQRLPMEAMAATCRAHGALIAVDAIQAAGVVPLDVADYDFVAAGGHKWQMGPEGAGWLYVNPRVAPTLRPLNAGWTSHEQAFDFLFSPDKLRYDKPLKQTAEVFEGGNPNTFGYAGLDAALALIESLGVTAIHAHVNGLLDQLEPALVERGFTSRRPADPGRRSGVLALAPPAGLDTGSIAQGLGRRGVGVTQPDGHLRFSPHWPNGAHEVPLIIGALDEVLAELRG